MLDRISKSRLEEIVPALGGRDKNILTSVQQCRYLTTRQVQRLHFIDSSTPIAGLKAANRNLKRLKSLGLVDAHERRIGGARAGSGSRIWYLTETGERLLRLSGNSARPRRRSARSFRR